ncbi:acyl-CoA thioesterase/bile acid-CoA:amino acid N-acyltransferase family protein [Saccharothrix algeriensis]|uniref:Dienelactone hydrolase n=3 Tax=Saccharothrix algeriensis TaxID=173560 RepID=A0ABS2SA78_9PSEU|nr:acyl-CoA thioesterase/bile acid-CoA:amino acid N-acyltransferase family protein [Saccharothrix algeriensis]MBM7813157.1 dienelactone hydrolase [Saccharothrix algeriensis]
MAEILVDPRCAPLDRTLDLRVVGLEPGGETTVRATTGDLAAQAVFRADDRGVVDLTRHAPVSGSYSGVDPMGLFWSLAPTGERPGPTRLEATGAEPVEITRPGVPEGIERTEAPDLSAVLFGPGDGAARPGVVVLGGEDGGRPERDAALLAGHGFTTLALPCTGAPGLPDDLVEVPLEHVGRAVDLLRERAGRVGLLGASRGGELALLAASAFPAVRAVVSVVGGGVVTQGIGPGKRLLEKLSAEVAAWTWRGRPLPYLPHYVPEELRRAVVAGEPVRLRPVVDLSDGIPEAAEIPVERVAGGVLLLSSGRDEVRPSAELSEVAQRRLAEHRHPFRYEHVVYPDAGHLIAGAPHRPATDLVTRGLGARLAAGGTPAATAAARADAWRRTIEFFSDQLGT